MYKQIDNHTIGKIKNYVAPDCSAVADAVLYPC